MEDFEEMCDDLDAAIFTGDHLEDETNRITLDNYIAAWKRKLDEYE